MWCSRNGLIPRSLKAAHKKRQEMLSMMESLELPISKPVEDQKVMETSVKKALLAGYFMQVSNFYCYNILKQIKILIFF